MKIKLEQWWACWEDWCFDKDHLGLYIVSVFGMIIAAIAIPVCLLTLVFSYMRMTCK